jgi:hypothetical protein
MAGNIAFDVVIGLIFIYLLYSLYATVTMEIISSLFGLRARNLRYVVRRMLMDEVAHKNYFANLGLQLLASFCQILGVKPINLTNPDLYEEFWKQPCIKSLSGGGLSNTPSYISGENFTKGLVDSLKLKYIEFGTLSAIEEGIDKLPNADTKKQLQSLLLDANNDLVKFNILVETWFNETMARATGWFKRTTQLFLFFIGAFLAFSFNVDTLRIIHKLSVNKGATEQLVKMAVDFNQNNSAIRDGSVKAKTDSAEKSRETAELKASLEKNIRESENLVSSGWHLSEKVRYVSNTVTELSKDSVYYAWAVKDKDAKADHILYLVLHQSIDPDLLANVIPAAVKPVSMNGFLQISPANYKYYYIRKHFLGYLITILALSLGAPFWFDLLNKVIKLRSSIPAIAGAVASPVTKVAVNSTLRRAG